MITILHGDNIDASRSSLVTLKEKAKGKELRTLTGSVDTTDIIQATESSSLFGGDTLIVLENVFGKLGKKQKKIEEIATILKTAGTTQDVIIWEDKEVGKTVLSQFGASARVELHKIPVLIFQFLDGMRPGNVQSLLSMYKEMIKTEAPELVLVMLERRVRQLIMIADNTTPAGMQSWQIGRLTSQAKLFTIEELYRMYTSLFDIEYASKTGTSPFSTSQMVEQFIISVS